MSGSDGSTSDRSRIRDRLAFGNGGGLAGRASAPIARTGRFLFREKDDYLYLLVVVAAGGYIFYTGLGAYPIRNWDEGIYANAAWNVLHGYPVVPHLHWMWGQDAGFQAFLEKPPLVMWLQALSMLVFGANEFAVRFPSATASVLTGALVYVMGRELFDSRAGALGALAFYTTPMVYVGFDAGRTGGLDMTLVFFGSLFVYLTYRIATGRDDRYGLVGVVAGLAVLAKGFAAGSFLLVVLPLVVVYRDRFLTFRFGRTLAATGLIVLPWTLYTWLRHGRRFVDEIFYEQVIARAGGRFAVDGGVFGFQNFPYLRNQFVAFDPWVYFLLPAVAVVGWGVYRERWERRPVAFFAWWFVAVFLWFLPTGNHAWYVLPMYVPAVVLIGGLLASALDGDRPAVVGTALGLATIAVLSIRMGEAGPRLIEGFALEWGFAGPYVTGVPYAFALAFAGAVVVMRRDLVGFAEWLVGPWYARVRPLLVIAVVAVFVFSLVLVPPDTAQFDDGWSAEQRGMGLRIDAHAPEGATVYFTLETVTSDNADDALHTLPFYAQREFEPATLGAIDRDSSIRYALVTAAQLDDVTRDHTVVQQIWVRGRTIVLLEFRG